MRTMRIIGMVLVAIVLSAGFTACSDDDDDSGSSSSLEKTLNGTTWKAPWDLSGANVTTFQKQ